MPADGRRLGVNVDGAALSQPFNVRRFGSRRATALIFTGRSAYSVDAKAFGGARGGGVITVGLVVVRVAAAVTTGSCEREPNRCNLASPSGL